MLRGVEVDAGHAEVADFPAAVRSVGLMPSRRAETPAAAAAEPDGAQVVAARGREVQEFVRHDSCHRVIARVLPPDARPAEPVPEVARHRLLRELFQGPLEDWFGG